METLDHLAGSLGGYHITRLEHSLQAATRARLDGADVNWVVAALVHDIGDELAPYNHSEYAASILQPYVPAEVHWVVLHHGVFQSYYYAHFLGGDRKARERTATTGGPGCARTSARTGTRTASTPTSRSTTWSRSVPTYTRCSAVRRGRPR